MICVLVLLNVINCLYTLININITLYNEMVMLASPECDKLRKDGFRSSQYYSQSPAFSSSSLCESVHLDEEKTEKKNKVCLNVPMDGRIGPKVNFLAVFVDRSG